ncbi:alpha/beta fold hydrolase [Solicola gregarius]|uniref:Alpha/beta hydrolase n=1 Tax=Solicola gregarius TaxID=2908642 RepID=A0AA46TFZ4_9ACTN|nr:alpha/beta hydrolase [Solicola gregarius]UYM04657.1 alpha/beta hydrolase [Solicola gregarius]
MDIVLIGGLWLDGSAWDKVAPALEERGHRPRPLTLPGQGDGNASATLDDQIAAVVAAVDASAEKPMVVGHSAASGLAWIAADRRPDKIAMSVMIGGFPGSDGETYADFFPVRDGAMPFPGWEPFDGPDTADLDDDTMAAVQSRMIPVPETVSRGIVSFVDERRYDMPAVLVCPEFAPADVKEWIAAGELPELTKARDVSYVDLDAGHWPMFSVPDELARVLSELAADADDGA